jgi:hypothetical protein
VNLKILSAAALAVACTLNTAGFAMSSASQKEATEPSSLSSPACGIHLYPADGPHTVGDDFDANHRVDQDLRHYAETAGHPLDWLSPSRQQVLLSALPIGSLLGVAEGSKTYHTQALTRAQALQPGPRTRSDNCSVEILIPQIMLERGALSARSLRVFGVIRRFEAGSQMAGYSGYASAPMTGFQMRAPADADAATAIIENAYREAVETLLRNSAKPPRK